MPDELEHILKKLSLRRTLLPIGAGPPSWESPLESLPRELLSICITLQAEEHFCSTSYLLKKDVGKYDLVEPPDSARRAAKREKTEESASHHLVMFAFAQLRAEML